MVGALERLTKDWPIKRREPSSPPISGLPETNVLVRKPALSELSSPLWGGGGGGGVCAIG